MLRFFVTLVKPPLFFLPILLLSCQGEIRDVRMKPAPTMDQLKNTTYKGLEFGSREVTLVDGVWEGDPAVEGSAARPSVRIVSDFQLNGDLDSNGTEETVILLSEDLGGTGTFIYLAVVGERDGTVSNLGTAFIGDRVQLRNAWIDGITIYFDLVEIGPDDRACCPGHLTRRAWDLLPRGLFRLSYEETGRLSLRTLESNEWILHSWSDEERAPRIPEITLSVDSSRFVGMSGCNEYFSSVEEGVRPGEITTGPVAATRKMCAEQEMTAESRFLSALEGATQFGFLAGRLMIATVVDGKPVRMTFEKRNTE